MTNMPPPHVSLRDRCCSICRSHEGLESGPHSVACVTGRKSLGGLGFGVVGVPYSDVHLVMCIWAGGGLIRGKEGFALKCGRLGGENGMCSRSFARLSSAWFSFSVLCSLRLFKPCRHFCIGEFCAVLPLDIRHQVFHLVVQRGSAALSLMLRERQGQGQEAVVEQLRNEVFMKDMEISRLKVSDYACWTSS